MTSTEGPILSVVVCTTNGAGIVGGAIDSLFNQTLEQELYEVIVVDNRSRDSTRRIVEQRAKEHRLRYVFEDRLGLASARNRGYQVATTQYVGFIDDDARADPNALEMAVESLSDHSDVLCVGGRIVPFYTTPKPDWFKDEYEARSWGSSERYLRRGESFSGSNMFWRRVVLAKYGGFPAELGVLGQRLALGEEAALFTAIWESDPAARFWYSPELIVRHWVPPLKLSPSYALKRALVTGEYAARSGDPTQPAAARAVRYLLRLLRSAAPAASRFRTHRYWQRWVYEDLAAAFVPLGGLLVSLGIRFRFRRRVEAAAAAAGVESGPATAAQRSA
jgi:glucosyl-dolichyl phosphate glucuronosyltransferase